MNKEVILSTAKTDSSYKLCPQLC